MKIIDPNSPLIQALGKLSDIILCNILFVIFSAPIFTIGASLAALYSCTQKLAVDMEDDLVVRDFWKAFKVNFKQATAIWLLCMVAAGVLTAFYFVTSAMIDTLGRGYLIPYFVVVALFLCAYQYVFPMQARYRLKVRHTLKNAALLSVAALPWTLLSLAVTIGAVYLTFFMDPQGFNAGLFIWAVGGFGIVCYLNTLLFRKAFRKLNVEQLALQASSITPEEALFVDEMHQSADRVHMHQISSYSDPNWNRREYPLSDRSDVQGRGNNRDWKRKKSKR